MSSFYDSRPEVVEMFQGLREALPAEQYSLIEHAYRAASTTGDCSSRLQDSELDALKVRVGVLEGALRDLLDTMERGDEFKAFERMQAARSVLAGGEAGKAKP